MALLELVLFFNCIPLTTIERSWDELEFDVFVFSLTEEAALPLGVIKQVSKSNKLSPILLITPPAYVFQNLTIEQEQTIPSVERIRSLYQSALHSHPNCSGHFFSFVLRQAQV